MSCSGCSKVEQQMQLGSTAYKGQMMKPNAMVSKSSIGFSFGPYGARKASEVVGRVKMPPMPKLARR